MGKKSRRQREAGGGTLQMKPERRFERDHWTRKDGGRVTGEETKKLYRAMQFSGLIQDFTLAQEEFKQEYMCLVVSRKLAREGAGSAIEHWKRWPQMQTHWPRIRRRICDQCGRRVALSKPRYLVCGGCGAARYCSEACQIANWGHHQTVCAALARQAARDGKASTTAKAAPFKARGVLKGVRNTLNSPFVHVDDF